MKKVVLIVACAVVIGLPDFLCAHRQKSISSKRLKKDSCVVPKIKNGGIRIGKTIKRLDWHTFQLVNSKMYEKVKPGSKVFSNSLVFLSCINGYSKKGEGDMLTPIFCKSGKWKPRAICSNNAACKDAPRPDGISVSYLRPGTFKTSFSESESSGLGEEDPSSGDLPIFTASTERKKFSRSTGFHPRGTQAIYSCKSKYYELVGSEIRVCKKKGKWSGTTPICVPTCGRAYSPRSPLISYGDATDVGQWPWQAALTEFYPKSDTWYFKCGGSLLNELWVITAAHCVTYDKSAIALPPEELKVYLGKYHRNDARDDRLVQVKQVSKVRVHPKYNYSEFDADIALLKLDTPVKMNSRVQPVCLPTKETSRKNLVEGRKGVVTGWGRNEEKKLSDTMQQAVLPVVSQYRCINGFRKANLSLIVTKNMFCAGYDNGKPDTCGGDSGGPVVFTDPSSEEKTWVIEGIVSWGSPHGCGSPDQYGVYTTVSKFLDWIHLYV